MSYSGNVLFGHLPSHSVGLCLAGRMLAIFASDPIFCLPVMFTCHRPLH